MWEDLISDINRYVISLENLKNWSLSLDCQISPYLTSVDFFLWGYLKAQVYARKLQSLHELKGYIKDEAAKIQQNMCKNAVNSFVTRLHRYIDVHGQSVEKYYIL